MEELSIKKTNYTDYDVICKYRQNKFFPMYYGDLNGILQVGDKIRRNIDMSNKNTTNKEDVKCLEGEVIYIHSEGRFFRARFYNSTRTGSIVVAFPMFVCVEDVLKDLKKKEARELYEKIGLLPDDTKEIIDSVSAAAGEDVLSPGENLLNSLYNAHKNARNNLKE